jgi:hypothetical protein
MAKHGIFQLDFHASGIINRKKNEAVSFAGQAIAFSVLISPYT